MWMMIIYVWLRMGRGGSGKETKRWRYTCHSHALRLTTLLSKSIHHTTTHKARTFDLIRKTNNDNDNNHVISTVWLFLGQDELLWRKGFKLSKALHREPASHNHKRARETFWLHSFCFFLNSVHKIWSMLVVVVATVVVLSPAMVWFRKRKEKWQTRLFQQASHTHP